MIICHPTWVGSAMRLRRPANSSHLVSSSSGQAKTTPQVWKKSMRHWMEQELVQYWLQQQHDNNDFCREAVPKFDTNGLLQLTDLLSGHLVGGKPKHESWKHSNNSMTVPSLTSILISRVVGWLQQQYTDVNGDDQADLWKQHGKNCDSSSSVYSSDDDDTSDDDDDNSSCDSRDPVVERRASESSITVVSSQAEAYYAHTTVTKTPPTVLQDCNVYEEQNNNNHETRRNGQHHLDYDITQMDIVRMTRNASRHLDVESILKLPTVTYQEESQPPSLLLLLLLLLLLQLQKKKVVGCGCEKKEGLRKKKRRRKRRQALPKRDKNLDNTDACCVICLEHFQQGDCLRVLPCDHSFHVGCIDQWLSGSHSFAECYTTGCPTCKKRPYQADDNDVVWEQQQHEWDGSVPSWAFSKIGELHPVAAAGPWRAADWQRGSFPCAFLTARFGTELSRILIPLVAANARQQHRIRSTALIKRFLREGVVLSVNGGTTNQGVFHLYGKAIAIAQSLNHTLGGGHDFGTNAVAGECSDCVRVFFLGRLQLCGCGLPYYCRRMVRHKGVGVGFWYGEAHCQKNCCCLQHGKSSCCCDTHSIRKSRVESDCLLHAAVSSIVHTPFLCARGR